MNHPTFQAWLTGVSHTLYCPGLRKSQRAVKAKSESRSGKNSDNVRDALKANYLTYFSSIVIDELEAKLVANDIGIAYLYFDYKEKENQTAAGVVASLVRQLISRVDDIIPDLYPLYKTFRSRGKTPELQHLLEALIIVSKSFTCSIIILDALDECDKVQRRSLLQVLRRLTRPTFKIFATSRPHLMDGKDYFNESSSIWIAAESTDIVNFLNTRVNEERPRYRKLKARIIEKISVSANGV